MEYLVIGLIFLLGLLDVGIFLFLFNNPHYGKEVLVVHIVIYLIIKFFADKYLDDYDGVPTYLALFLPGLGEMVVSILYFSIHYFLRDSIVLNDYERYIKYQRFLDYNDKIDFEKELQTISFLDQMNLLDGDSKKQLIIDSSLNQYVGKIKLLQKGLMDWDGEVKHYSAVSINMIENEFSHLITQLREDFNLNKNLSTLQKLRQVYKNYIESGLISGEVLQIFNSEYIDILNKLRGLKKETPEILEELIVAYIRGGNFERSEEINRILLNIFPERFEGILYQLQIAYEKKDFTELNRVLLDLKKREIEIPKKYQTILAYWIGKEEIA
ncbi:MAG: hypothetical protein KAX49_03420 [Halanaerobiales bacterium]|nr:hypothetical protein [Halanaerobiales bacterium]